MENETDQFDSIGISDIRSFYDSSALHRIESLRNRETFMELCRIRTWETSHSSFLKWLFSNSEFARLSLSPVINLVRLYAAKAIDQHVDDVDTHILNDFLSGGVRNARNMLGEIELSTDNKRRIDIELVFEYNDDKRLRICIENKLYSSEHTDQCAEYYNYYKRKGDGIPTIFIFLSPDKSNRTDEPHYVNMTYQELYDSVLKPLQKYHSEHHCNRYIQYVNDYIDSLTSIRNNYKPIVMSSEYKELLKEIYENHRDLFLEVINEWGTEEEKKLVNVSTGGNIKYTITTPNGGIDSALGFTRMARLVIAKLVKQVKAQDLVDKLGKIRIPNFDTEGICFPETKGADSRYSKSPIQTPNGLLIYVSNQWNKAKADKFIQQVKDAKFPIEITETTI